MQDPEVFFEIFHDLADVILIINSCMTLHIAAVVFYFFVANLVSIFGFIWTTVNTKFFYMSLSSDLLFFVLNNVTHGIMAYASSSATQEADKIAVTVSKIINGHRCGRIDQKIFKNFLHQHQYRNLNFENVFFVINWKLVLAVNTDFFSYKNNSSKLFTGLVYNCYVFDNHLSV